MRLEYHKTKEKTRIIIKMKTIKYEKLYSRLDRKKDKQGLYFDESKRKETRNLTDVKRIKGKEQKILINGEDINRVL